MLKYKLFQRWTLANALAEFFGLGLTFLLTGFAFSKLDSQGTVTSIILSFVFAVLSGAVEATIVGLAQWWAMNPWFEKLTRFGWWRATFIGALVAYVLGYLPSTLMSMGEATSQSAPMEEPAQWIVLLLASGMGAVGGVVLSFAQWLELKKQVDGAGIWIPANMLAWAAGMPVIFWGVDKAFNVASIWQSVLVMAMSLLVAGAVVGAIHGAFLVKLVKE